jgi:hypothetical protein
MTVLADTSVWIAHLRKSDPALGDLLRGGLVVMHAFVLGELACGNLRQRSSILRDLGTLQQVQRALDTEVMRLLEERAMWGKGLGWIDLHLLASALISGSRLWTLDRRLHAAASRMGVEWP